MLLEINPDNIDDRLIAQVVKVCKKAVSLSIPQIPCIRWAVI